MSPGIKIFINKAKVVIATGKPNKRKKSRKIRVVTGARNPYSVADAALSREDCAKKVSESLEMPEGKYIKPGTWHERSPKKNQKILEIIFQRKYHRLFDPVYGSAVFAKNIIETVQNLLPEKEEFLAIKTGASPESIKLCEGQRTVWKNLAGGAWFGEIDVATGRAKLNVNSPSFDDPVQGPVPDCYLIAVLSSLAWRHPEMIKGRVTYNIGFYGKNQPVLFGPKSPPGYKITPNIPFRDNIEPSGARSKDANEFWVQYYEKIYACYLEYNGRLNQQVPQPQPEFTPYISSPSPILDNPYICLIPEGDPSATLFLLTGIKPTTYIIKSDLNSDPKTVFGLLENNCLTDTGFPTKKTNGSAVAFTYCTGDPTLLESPSDCAPSSVVDYDDVLVCAAHSYSLLGIHKADGYDYVVLRNPCGSPWSFSKDPNVYGLLTKGNLEFDTTGQYSLSVPGAKTFIPNNGVFAMTKEKFTSLFRGFCWI